MGGVIELHAPGRAYADLTALASRMISTAREDGVEVYNLETRQPVIGWVDADKDNVIDPWSAKNWTIDNHYVKVMNSLALWLGRVPHRGSGSFVIVEETDGQVEAFVVAIRVTNSVQVEWSQPKYGHDLRELMAS